MTFLQSKKVNQRGWIWEVASTENCFLAVHFLQHHPTLISPAMTLRVSTKLPAMPLGTFLSDWLTAQCSQPEREPLRRAPPLHGRAGAPSSAVELVSAASSNKLRRCAGDACHGFFWRPPPLSLPVCWPTCPSMTEEQHDIQNGDGDQGVVFLLPSTLGLTRHTHC